MTDRERELTDAVTELSETLTELRRELHEPRGSPEFPRPPSPSSILRFTEQYTIPTVIALLETSIKVLELLAAALRVADGRPFDAVGERSTRHSDAGSFDSVSRAGRDRLAETTRETLQRLDEALADLQSAAAGEPSNSDARRLLEDARTLRAEVDERLGAAISDVDSPTTQDDGPSEPIEIGITAAEDETAHPDSSSEDVEHSQDAVDEGVGIDVDEELASIKEDLHDEQHSRRKRSENDEDND